MTRGTRLWSVLKCDSDVQSRLIMALLFTFVYNIGEEVEGVCQKKKY